MVQFHLDATSPIPLHYQLQQQLRAAIDGGHFRTGDTLPTEMELVATVGVSRSTVRQAIEQLAREGLVQRQRGRKTYVTAAPVPPRSTYNYTFVGDLPQRADATETRVISLKKSIATPEAAEALGLANDDQVVEIWRVRELDGHPVATDHIYLPAGRVPGIDQAGLAEGTLYDVLENRYHLSLSTAEETLKAVGLDGAVAKQLGVKAGAPGFQITRRTLAGDNPMELRISYIPAEYFQGTTALSRAQVGRD